MSNTDRLNKIDKRFKRAVKWHNIIDDAILFLFGFFIAELLFWLHLIIWDKSVGIFNYLTAALLLCVTALLMNIVSYVNLCLVDKKVKLMREKE